VRVILCSEWVLLTFKLFLQLDRDSLLVSSSNLYSFHRELELTFALA